MKGCTRAILSMAVGTLHAEDTKQKINVKISTKSELMVVDGCMPQILWTTYFIEDQGYKIDDSIIYQYNKSAMLLDKNVTLSIIKSTNHIIVCHYFISNKVEKGQFRLDH